MIRLADLNSKTATQVELWMAKTLPAPDLLLINYIYVIA